MSTRTEVVSVVFVKTQVELGTMLNDSGVEG